MCCKTAELTHALVYFIVPAYELILAFILQ
jgi:hypothetical protein